VLGYSDGRADGLHPICAARVETAAARATGARAILVSGWARRPGYVPEAEHMRRALEAAPCEIVADPVSRITAETAAEAAALAGRLGVEEIEVVTSRWHAPRAAILFRRATAGTGVDVRIRRASGPWSARLLARELAAYATLPVQFGTLRRR
jgi:hypothetical protein